VSCKEKLYRPAYNSDLRYFFYPHIPPCSRILLIESGSRRLIERLIPCLRDQFGQDVEMDLVTCYAGEPAGFQGRVFNVNDYGGAAGRHALRTDLAERQYSVAGVICAAEPIMTKWKWWLCAKLPAKIFIINENGDYFWLDRAHSRQLRQFVAYRLGLTGSAAVPALVRLACFPVTLAYLLLYAGTVHLRRKLRQS
jgi:hypothetical protein